MEVNLLIEDRLMVMNLRRPQKEDSTWQGMLDGRVWHGLVVSTWRTAHCRTVRCLRYYKVLDAFNSRLSR